MYKDSAHPPTKYKGGEGDLNLPKSARTGWIENLWKKWGEFMIKKKGDHFERGDQSQKVKFLK